MLVEHERARHSGVVIAPHHRIALSIKGNLPQETLANALNTLIDRHEALRATFARSDGVSSDEARLLLWSPQLSRSLFPFEQRIAAAACIRINESLRGTRIHHASRYQVGREGFDYAVSPLMRVEPVATSRSRQLLVITVPKIVADAASCGILERELRELCVAAISGESAQLPALPLAYGAYLRSEEHRCRLGAYRRAGHFWEQIWERYAHLQFEPPDIPFALPGFHAQTPRDTEARVECLTCSSDYVQQIQECAQLFGTDEVAICLTAVVVTVKRYTARSQFPIWFRFSNRQAPDRKLIVGNLEAPQMMGFDLTRCRTVGDVTESVAQALKDALPHQGMPLQWLAGRTRALRMRVRGVPIEVDACRAGSHREVVDHAAISIRRVRLPSALPQFVGLRVGVCVSDRRIVLSATYNVNHFEGRLVRQWLRAIRDNLQLVMSAPSMALSRM